MWDPPSAHTSSRGGVFDTAVTAVQVNPFGPSAAAAVITATELESAPKILRNWSGSTGMDARPQRCGLRNLDRN
ncbi:hypothetical protein GCM10017667_06590 [Streptomyces filamentosus]|uniref:Uncharacterized protein n=1 Tax=Streptomyces filamentosus TaxID=67294 RepID=A0A919EGX9_STRFL|nr:hypothetical protein GCM10017667_06590 [Streptomyces filamentosus]